jgi:hypothetical protein
MDAQGGGGETFEPAICQPVRLSTDAATRCSVGAENDSTLLWFRWRSGAAIVACYRSLRHPCRSFRTPADHSALLGGFPTASATLARLFRSHRYRTPQRERPKVMVAQAKRIGYVVPAYPRKALEEGLSGSVTVDFIVDAKGEQTELRIADAKPLGFSIRPPSRRSNTSDMSPSGSMVCSHWYPVVLSCASIRKAPERAWRGAP